MSFTNGKMVAGLLAIAVASADDSIKENASNAGGAGLEVRVTRRYDGVGVHDGKDTCMWCLERCGENMTLQEAYGKGAFQRHEGCGCELLYKPRKGEWQRQTNWRSNNWGSANNRQNALQRKTRHTRLITPKEKIVRSNYHLSASVSKDVDGTIRKELGSVDPDRAKDTIDYFKNVIQDEPIENAIVVERSGLVVHFVGGESGVNLFNVDLEGAHILHNHPEMNGIVSFGEDDFYTIREHQGAIYDLVNPRYEYHLEVLQDISHITYNDLYLEAIINHAEGGDLQDEAMEVLKKRGYVIYDKRPIKR